MSRRIMIVADTADNRQIMRDLLSTAGYDLALAEFTIDSVGLGKGTMAPAAKVKPGGTAGIEVDDYSGKRIELVTVSRNLS